MNPPRAVHAFTFVEILAAMVFLGILIPAILTGITIASRAEVTAERQAIAAELAQNKLNELALDDAWESSDMSGDFGDDWPGIRWEAEHTDWDMDSMEVLTVRTFYTVRGEEQHLEMSTLVSSTATTTATSSSSAGSSSSNISK